MKKVLLPLFFLFVQLSVYAQDILISRAGDEIKAKVIEVNPTEIKYQAYHVVGDSLELIGNILTLPKVDVFMIKYQNGVKEVFGETTQPEPQKPAYAEARPLLTGDLYQKGQNDAITHYRSYKGAGTGTLVSTLLFPPAGLITAVACSSTPPKVHNLAYPDDQLFQNATYRNGYQHRARRIKAGRVWRNFGIGFGSLLLLNILLASGN